MKQIVKIMMAALIVASLQPIELDNKNGKLIIKPNL